MNNKVGIITFIEGTNFGACLQAHATQIVLEKIGCEALLIYYGFIDDYKYFPFGKGNIKTFIANLMYYRLRKSQHLAFNEFRKKMKIYPQKLYSIRDFKNIVEYFDVFFIGSDQVWNSYLPIDLRITLLEFVSSSDRMKVSYASSFGENDVPENLTLRYREALSEFKQLSVREKVGQNFLREKLGLNCELHIDPSMLLSARDWEPFLEPIEVQNEFLLLYDMQHDKNILNFAKEIANKENLIIYALSRVNILDKQVRMLYNVSPGKFLTLIKEAKVVVTDSFHGTVFSIIFHKQFFSYVNELNGKVKSKRIINLLETFNIEDRIINKYQHKKISLINYYSIESLLEFQRERSFEYLKDIFKEKS